MNGSLHPELLCCAPHPPSKLPFPTPTLGVQSLTPFYHPTICSLRSTDFVLPCPHSFFMAFIQSPSFNPLSLLVPIWLIHESCIYKYEQGYSILGDCWGSLIQQVPKQTPLPSTPKTIPTLSSHSIKTLLETLSLCSDPNSILSIPATSPSKCPLEIDLSLIMWHIWLL